MANRYTRALKQIKDKTLDEKLELLSEIPTNNTAGLYVDTTWRIMRTPEEIVPGDIADSQQNLEEDGARSIEGYTGNDTTGLFHGMMEQSDLVEPPGDTSYILGPMMFYVVCLGKLYSDWLYSPI